MLSIRAERLGKIIFLHAWLGLSVKKGTQLRAGGRWQIKAASFLTDLPGVRPGRARGGRNNGSHLQKNQTPSACTCLQVGKKQKEAGLHPQRASRAPGSGCGRAGMSVGTTWGSVESMQTSGGCQSNPEKPNPVHGLKEPNPVGSLKKSDPSPSSARDLMQHSPCISRNRSRLGRDLQAPGSPILCTKPFGKHLFCILGGSKALHYSESLDHQILWV